MRRILVLLATGAVLAPLSACGSGTPDEPPAPASSAPAPGGAASPSTEAAPSPSAPGTTTGTPPPEPSSGELPGGLPFGERDLTGVVERAGDCTMLRVGSRLWGLTGTPVPGLRTGAQVTVSGQVTTPDPACGPEVARGLVVQRATPV
jgi:hypothetical protein